ncbi:hypothetical protein BD560DRAFT_202809 [Blakeslea trispora]|nr:hypothetical protein BD560DRAFT_202809 [Blakeslea trispora]
MIVICMRLGKGSVELSLPSIRAPIVTSFLYLYISTSKGRVASSCLAGICSTIWLLDS